MPGSDWNYALCFILESNGPKKFPLISVNYSKDSYFRVRYNEVPEDSYPWEYPPVELICKGKKIDHWNLLEDNVTPEVPQSPVIDNNPEEEISLVPFGCAPIRISYFPVTEKQQELIINFLSCPLKKILSVGCNYFFDVDIYQLV